MLTANDLRAIAEAADGNRGVTLELTMNSGRPKLSKVKNEDVSGRAAANAILVKTVDQVENRKRPKSVVLTTPSGRVVDLPTHYYDMVLWGEAAAEKFLIPYYVRFKNEQEMGVLKSFVYSNEVVAILHVYPTIYEDIRDGLFMLGGMHPELVAVLNRGEVRDEFWVLTDSENEAFTNGFVPLSFWLAMQ